MKIQSFDNSVLRLLLGSIAMLALAVGCDDGSSTAKTTSVVTVTTDGSAQTPQETAAATQTASSVPDSYLGQATSLVDSASQATMDSAKSAGGWVQDKVGDATQSTSQAAQDSWDWANQTFQDLKDKGLTSAESTSEWLSEDWKNMESWEYRVEIPDTPATDLQEQLNALGKEGWECIEFSGEQMILKRRKHSYLGHLPFRDLIRLAPLLDRK